MNQELLVSILEDISSKLDTVIDHLEDIENNTSSTSSEVGYIYTNTQTLSGIWEDLRGIKSTLENK